MRNIQDYLVIEYIRSLNDRSLSRDDVDFKRHVLHSAIAESSDKLNKLNLLVDYFAMDLKESLALEPEVHEWFLELAYNTSAFAESPEVDVDSLGSFLAATYWSYEGYVPFLVLQTLMTFLRARPRTVALASNFLAYDDSRMVKPENERMLVAFVDTTVDYEIWSEEHDQDRTSTRLLRKILQSTEGQTQELVRARILARSDDLQGSIGDRLGALVREFDDQR